LEYVLIRVLADSEADIVKSAITGIAHLNQPYEFTKIINEVSKRPPTLSVALTLGLRPLRKDLFEKHSPLDN
jgi:hypothetical protein